MSDPETYLERLAAEEARQAPRYVISIAAELAGMHPQTLRQYDRLGLVVPARTRGGGRRYSVRDVERLREVQRLSQEEGVNLAGIHRIMQLERDLEVLQAKVDRLEVLVHEENRVFVANSDGQIVTIQRGQRPARGTEMIQVSRSSALVVWEP